MIWVESFAFEDWKSLVYVLCTKICISGHQCQSLAFCNSSHATNMELSQKNNKKRHQINITNWVAKNIHFHLYFCIVTVRQLHHWVSVPMELESKSKSLSFSSYGTFTKKPLQNHIYTQASFKKQEIRFVDLLSSFAPSFSVIVLWWY